MRKEKTLEKKKADSLMQLLRYLFKYKFYILIICVLVIVANLLALRIPYITGLMVDAIGLGPEKIDFNFLIKGGLTILLIAAATWGLSIAQNLFMLKTAQNVVLDLRRDVFAKLVKLPVSYFDNNTKGNIISIVTTDIDNISETVSADAITLLTGFVTVIGSLTFMLSISPWITLIFVFTVPMMFISARIISKRSRALFRTKKAAYGEICGYSEEMITAQKTIKVYGIEEYNKNIFYEISQRLKESGAKAEFSSSLMMPTMNALNNLNFTLICIMGAFLVLNGKISIGNISTFIMYSKRFAGPIIDTANILNMFQASLAACDRVFSILNHPEEKDESQLSEEELKIVDTILGEVKFEKVSFSYQPETPILKHISLTVKPGQKVAIVGATGSGKTTIISLLMRFYDTTEGRITIDGTDIRDLPLAHLRHYFALVLQDSWLFEGDVYENIGYAAPEDRRNKEKMRELCKQIEVDDFIESLPNGYDTLLQSDSGGLSVGQKQLLNIARTFMCNPPIFILDEATSSVDPLTETKIKVVTDKVIEGKTSFIIAHRLSTILNADVILVMKDGEICESGSHKELIQKDGLYKNLYESQFVSELSEE
ncbi:MAG: ABC transporter ATP-binding protein [Cellulosilyticaceae bacterium]